MRADHIFKGLYFLFINVFTQNVIDYSKDTLTTSFSNCVSTKSPVDIPYYSTLIDVDFERFIIRHSFYTSINNIQLKLEDGAYKRPYLPLEGLGSIFINIGPAIVKYDLKEITFHVFSEHTFEGKKNELEMQIIHGLDESTDNYTPPSSPGQPVNDPIPLNSNKYLVVSILFSIENDQESDFLNDLYKGIVGTISKLDLNQFINFHKGYYYYNGMITVPNKCDEVSTVAAMKKVYPMSLRQLKIFQTLLNADYPNGNALRTDIVYPENSGLLPTIFYVAKGGLLKLSTLLLIWLSFITLF